MNPKPNELVGFLGDTHWGIYICVALRIIR